MPEARISLGALVWGIAFLLPLSLVLSTLSALLERSGPIRLRHWAETAGGSLRALYDSPVRFGVFRFLLSFLARVGSLVLYVLVALLLAGLNRAHPHLWALLILAVLLALAEVGNRSLVAHDPERALRRLTRVYRAGLLVLRPLVALLAPLVPERAVGRDEAEEAGEASDEEIEAFIDVGTREGIIEPENREMLWGLVDFVDNPARSVMTPRIDIVCAPIESTLEDLAERFVESGHSRLPIFEGSIDRIVGILHIRDLLRAIRLPHPPHSPHPPDAERPALRELLKPPLFIPETKPLGQLLKELQKRFQQVAVVVDEYGGTAGLVTVEDIVEEIVGEIVDEHDALVAELEPLPEGNGYRLDGRARIELLDELFEVDIEDAEYETVAGLIFTELGHVPEVGETVEREGLRFTIEAVDDRRIEKVRVERMEEPAAATGSGT